MKEYDFDPNKLPTALLEAIGLAIASATHTEVQVNQAIAGLAGVEFDLGGAITTHMNMSLKFNVLFSLGERRFSDKDELAIFDQVVLDVQNAFQKRNSLAHDQWARDPIDDSLGQVLESARSHYTMNLVPSSVDEVKVIATELYAVGMRLFEFLRSRDLIAIIPDSQRPRAHESNAARKAYRKSLFG